ncbi:MAG: quinolinate synthase NadA [Myxococcales bacterium]|nr:quinolinate synthase NadA [Myxococcales bacterium]MCA9658649.1 quinolinate synthase NadA [Myxococcales bacterium]
MPSFPSLLLRADTIAAQGAFAEAQAEFFDPDPDTVQALRERLAAVDGGVVAHFYMDPELQGVLYGVDWPHIHISDSLVMADRAIAMAEAGAKAIAVLGVDFMSENVRAMLDAAGHRDVGVYRVSERAIGCSLAESAEALAYGAYLERAASFPNSLHVVYINTSLRTKAYAHRKVPTITCTSSNVLRTVLQAFAQEPRAHVWFGPDTYMGENLEKMLAALAGMDAAAVAGIHPEHTPASIAAILRENRFHYFEAGNCVVHHMFGAEVVATIEREYLDNTDITAHLEVPGEMFSLGLAASQRGRGVVGSTSDILRFIRGRVEAAGSGETSERHLRFILGTEAGMVTAIVHALRPTLAKHPEITVEIIFPVASEAIAITGDAELPLVPGVAAGEGCSTAGGCATCPFMKMNTLDALMDVLGRVRGGDPTLAAYEPKKYAERLGGETVAAVGSQPILHMRAFQASGRLPDALIADIRGRAAS